MASIYLRKNSLSKCWMARFKVWSAEKGRWEFVGRSTGTHDRAAALAIANQFQAAAVAAAPAGAGPGNGRGRQLSSGDVRRLVESILVTAGTASDALDGALMAPGDLVARHWLPDKRAGKTRADYEAVWERLRSWCESNRVGLDRFERFTPLHAERWREHLRELGLSANRVNFHLTVMGGLWIKAMRLGHAQLNPFAAIGRVELSESADNRAARPFSAEELARLIAAPRLLAESEARTAPGKGWWTKERADQWALAIRIGRVTGARLGDVTRLRREDIDRDSGDLDFVPAKTRKSAGGKRILFPVGVFDPGLARDLIGLAGESGFLMPLLAGVSTSSAIGLSAQFREIMVAAEIPLEAPDAVSGLGRRRWSHGFHSLRHTAVTGAMALGLAPELRQALFGHSSAEMNRKYTHWDTTELRRQVAEKVRGPGGE